MKHPRPLIARRARFPNCLVARDASDAAQPPDSLTLHVRMKEHQIALGYAGGPTVLRKPDVPTKFVITELLEPPDLELIVCGTDVLDPKFHRG